MAPRRAAPAMRLCFVVTHRIGTLQDDVTYGVESREHSDGRIAYRPGGAFMDDRWQGRRLGYGAKQRQRSVGDAKLSVKGLTRRE